MKDQLRDWLADGAGFDAALCESPIERMFLAGLSYQIARYNEKSLARIPLKVKCQKGFNNRRVDFFLECQQSTLVVECDGHDFHERTKEQAASDKSRDRWFISEGHKVVRFTGSEVWANPFACAEQALQIVAATYIAERRKNLAREHLAKMADVLSDDSTKERKHA